MTQKHLEPPSTVKLSIKARLSIFFIIIVAIVMIENNLVIKNIQSIVPLVDDQLELIATQSAKSDQQIALISTQQINIERVNQINRAINLLNETTYWYFQGALTLVTASLDSGREKHAQLLEQLTQMSKRDPDQAETFTLVMEEADGFKLYAERMFVMFESNSVSMGKSMGEGAKLQADKVLTQLNALRELYVEDQAQSMMQISQGSSGIKSAGEAAYEAGGGISELAENVARKAKNYNLILLVVMLVLGFACVSLVLKPIVLLKKKFSASLATGTKKLDERVHPELSGLCWLLIIKWRHWSRQSKNFLNRPNYCNQSFA